MTDTLAGHVHKDMRKETGKSFFFATDLPLVEPMDLICVSHGPFFIGPARKLQDKLRPVTNKGYRSYDGEHELCLLFHSLSPGNWHCLFHMVGAQKISVDEKQIE